MKILVFFPYNQVSVEQQSVMKMLAESGHVVTLLTLAPEGPLHAAVRNYGVEAFSTGYGEGYSWKKITGNARVLKRICSGRNIEMILAHQQSCAVILAFAGKKLCSKSFYFRHNTDEDYNKGYLKAFLLNRFANAFVKHLVAPSDVVYRFWADREKVNPRRIQRINYGYDFGLYGTADDANVAAVKKDYSCALLIISIARFVEAKRHRIMFEAVEACIRQNMDVKMICLGDGPLKPAMEEMIKSRKLEDRIFLLGRKSNVLDYLTAADVLLHLSNSEASNSVVKEAALAYTPAIVCENVGDFSDYIENGKNGFLMEKMQPGSGAAAVLQSLYAGKINLKSVSDNAHHSIVAHFSIENVRAQYEALIAASGK